jgi:hypothetical protein
MPGSKPPDAPRDRAIAAEGKGESTAQRPEDADVPST